MKKVMLDNGYIGLLASINSDGVATILHIDQHGQEREVIGHIFKYY